MHAPDSPPPARHGHRALFLVLTVLLTLAACEGLAALYKSYYNRHVGGTGYPAGFFQADSALGFRMPANYDGHFARDAFAHVRIRTNAQGYRDAPFVSADSLIALIGDSVVFGVGVPVEERMDAALEAELEAGTGRDWEVWNLGVNAYSLDHYLRLLESGLLRGPAPDRVIVGLCMNDLEHLTEAWPHWAARPTRAARLRQASAIAWLAFHLWKQVPGREPGPGGDWKLWFAATGTQWEKPEAEARFRKRIGEITDAAPAPVLYVIWPTLFELQGGELGASSRARVHMARWLSEDGREFLDPFPLFQAAGDPERLFLEGDPLHFSAAGHAIAGRAIAAYLLDPASAIGH